LFFSPPFLPYCVYNCYIMDCTYHSHNSFVLPHLYHYVTSLWNVDCLFSQAFAFPFWVMWNAPVSPQSAADSHVSV
jgi:hypothetical protein